MRTDAFGKGFDIRGVAVTGTGKPSASSEKRGKKKVARPKAA
ncbi:MAG: hypothetical protein Q7S32_02465 [bacterium]|nr:hypothetical protein [bacterium]